jgi:hypothetical protein
VGTNLIKSKSFLINFLKILVLVLSVFFIYYRVFINQDLNLFVSEFNQAFSKRLHLLYFFIVILLFGMNWLSESYKWKFLLKKFLHISLIDSVNAVFAGVTVGLFTPNRVGEYGGRIIFIKSSERVNAIMATIAGNIAQLVATLIFGTIGFIFLFKKHASVQIPYYWLVLLVVGVIAVVILFFGIQKIPAYLPVRIRKYVNVLSLYSFTELSIVLLISIIRYGFFFFQYLLLLWFFDVNIFLHQALYLIPAVFLIISIIPTFALVEWGVRGASALAVIGLISVNDAGILSASTLLWMINIAIPAVLGTINILRADIR